jgi:hypothetical protein
MYNLTMVRFALILVYFCSVLICPTRCSKSLIPEQSSPTLRHVHCCSACKASVADNDIEEIAESETIQVSSETDSHSNCGCLQCVCKGLVATAELDKFKDSQHLAFSYPRQKPTWKPTLADTSVVLRSDRFLYGLSMRQQLQSWQI